MGYTHYWKPVKVDQQTWNKFVTVCIILKNNLPKSSKSAGGYYKDVPIVICGGDGTGEPDFELGDGRNIVCFNGTEENDLGHETFVVGKDKIDWDFCKTAGKPYDLLVGACLVAAHEILGYKVSSDGQGKDWRPIFDHYEKIIGKISVPRKKFFQKTI